MKISWKKRLELKNDLNKMQDYFVSYHYGCAENVIDFINRFCWTFDPRKQTEREMPFELFDKQEKYIAWLWDRYTLREDGVIDKCRGVGYSWLNAAFAVYLLLFQESVTVSMYTYKADECHKLGDMDTLLEKMIFIIDWLPKEFTTGVDPKHMQIKNTINGSIIAGKSGDNAGRGGRSSIFFLDECAFYPRAEGIEASVSRNSDCKIWGSTHNGTNTLFYRKCTGGINDVFTFDWWEIPLYNQDWYDKEKEKAEAEGTIHVFKQEVERDASASVENVVCPSDWVNMTKRNEEHREGYKIGALDPANEGGDTHGFVIIDGNKPVFCEESGTGDPGDATDLFFWKAIEYNCDEFRYDPIGVGAGVKVRLKEIQDKFPSNHPVNTIKINPWFASGKVLRPKQRNDQGKMNKELFENAKAQAWWKAREEFRNTYRMVNGTDYDPTEVISLYNLNTRPLEKMIRELSQPQFKLSSSGRTMIDKKPKGTKSPNLADAYVMARAEIELREMSSGSVAFNF